MAHIELITPTDRLNGYGPPSTPATAAELIASLNDPQVKKLGVVVWKVARIPPDAEASSCLRRQWNYQPHLLRFDRANIRCKVIGSQGGWWFVSVKRTEGIDALERRRHGTEKRRAA